MNEGLFHKFILFNISLSHRAEGKIRHCRFVEEASQFTIGSASFETMTELISYYENNPLYRRMKLKYAINEEILKQIGEVSDTGTDQSSGGVSVGTCLYIGPRKWYLYLSLL